MSIELTHEQQMSLAEAEAEGIGHHEAAIKLADALQDIHNLFGDDEQIKGIISGVDEYVRIYQGCSV